MMYSPTFNRSSLRLCGLGLIALVALAVGFEPIGNPVATDGMRPLTPGDAVDPTPRLPAPHLEGYSNSGCHEGRDGWCEGDETVEFRVIGFGLHVAHLNATYNCCPDDIVVTAELDGDTIRFFEREVLTMPCDCMCCYDVEAQFVGLPAGTYTAVYCWDDYEWGTERCEQAEIVVPGDAGLGLAPAKPEVGAGAIEPMSPGTGVEPQSRAHLESYSNSGCQDGRGEWCEDDTVEFRVVGFGLHVTHADATYNCCADDIVVTAELDGDTIRFTESEEITYWCACMCCYDVEAHFVGLPAGTYTVEYCWYDEDLWTERCEVAEIVVPGDAGLGLVPAAPVTIREALKPMLPGAGAEPQSRAHVETYGDSGCLPTRDGWCEGDEVIDLTVAPGRLFTLHRNAEYNCCPDEIAVSVTVEDRVIRITETEILTLPCFCICCYDVDATIAGLLSGPYTVVYCWDDYTPPGEHCEEFEIVIP